MLSWGFSLHLWAKGCYCRTSKGYGKGASHLNASLDPVFWKIDEANAILFMGYT